jgi:nucleoside-diphosphate-sugar epimerase
MESKKRVLIIGANGVSGKYILRRMVNKFDIVAIDTHPLPLDMKNKPNIKFIEGDATLPNIL